MTIQEYLNTKGYNLKVDNIIGPNTINSLTEFVKSELTKRGWRFPVKGLIWLRTDTKLTNSFDDFVVVIVNGKVSSIAPCSTTAGDYYIYNPISYGGITGTAVACEQQVLNSHQFVTNSNWKNLWLGAPYFKQNSSISIYRDSKIDRNIDRNITQKGLFGINFHRGGVGIVNFNWSAGCFIVPDSYWFSIIKNFNEGDIIDITLIETL